MSFAIALQSYVFFMLFAIFFGKNFAESAKIPTFAPANEKQTGYREQKQKVGAIAQLVEHRTENPCVPGSNPGGTTNERPALVNSTGRFLICLAGAWRSQITKN